ncbi:MAG: site-specific DNA-methyltransferase [Patescibacteria group bacterium]|nr:site-specific DNA-methyltransferase [Patescibacteria group bacterium]
MENNQTKEKLLAEIDRLKKELKKKKKYGLVWEDKPEDVVEMCKEKLPVLKEVKSKEITTDKDKPVNLLIEGDNYHSLSVLNYTHKGKIDVIYIDPPYNTGNKDFKYNDSFVDKEDSFRHSKWLAFISKRLCLAKSLLSKDGVIFISIGEDEVAQLKLLCNEVFGEKNYITNFIWEKTQHFGRQKVNSYSNADYVLCYAKQLNNAGLKELLVESIKEEHEDAPLYNASNPVNTLTIPARKVIFNIPDGEYTRTTDEKYKLLQKVVVKNGKNKNALVLRFKSRWSQKNVEKELEKGTTFWVKSENFAIRAIYGSGKTSNESPKQIIFTNGNNEFVAKSRFGQKVGVNEEASNELFNMIGEQNIFEYPKPRTLVEYLTSLLFDHYENNYQKDITVLDFFAGSGSTGHAILNLNKIDNGKRVFILCTNNEENICSDICYPRIQKAIKGYKAKKGEKIDGLGGNLKYFKTDFVDYKEATDKNKIRLTEEAIEMLCVKEGTFEEIENRVGFKIFKNSEHYSGIIFDQLVIEDFKKAIKDIKGKISVYIFSLGDDSFEDEFEDVKQKVKLSPIPEAILKVYRRIYK